MPGQSSAMFTCWFAHDWHLNLLFRGGGGGNSNTTTSLMHPTLAKLAEYGVTAYTLSANSTGKLAFYCNLSSIFNT